MANLTKIILGLNILAAGAGIFFGLSKSSAAGELVDKVKAAETKASSATRKVTGLESEKKKLITDLSAKQTENATLQTSLNQTQQGKSTLDNQISTLQAEKQSLNTQLQNANTQMTQLQTEANGAKQARDERDAAQQQVATLQAEIAALKAPKTPKGPTKPKAGAGGKMGKIVNVDPGSGLLILNRGSAHGFKVGDQYNVFRNNRLIGRVEVTRLSPTNNSLSTALGTEGLGVPAGAQFQVNDDLMKIE